MKKYLKILVLIVILSTTRINGVKAESFYEDNWITGVYANLVDGDFSKPQLMRFIRRKSDNRPTYCITPRVLLYEDEVYSTTSDINLTQEQKKRIERLAYFGYGYKNHTSDEWYAITQFMIWKTVEPNMDIFFTDTRGGNRITRFTNEINELNSLVDSVDIFPNIPSIDMLPNSNKEVVDNSLNLYTLTVPNGIQASVNNNILTINSINEGKYTLQFDRKYTQYSNNPNYYSASRGQKLLLPGKLPSRNYQVDINVINGRIFITKQDSNNYQNLEGAMYDLYDSNYNYINTVTTDSNGEASFENLLYGTYYLLETKAPIGYRVDSTFHDITITDDYNYITFVDDKISATVILNKFISNKFMYIPEKDVEFEIYDSDNNLVETLITDSHGISSIVLTYGKYKIHQKTSKEGYQKVDNFYVEIEDEDDKIFYIKDDEVEEKNEEPIEDPVEEQEEKKEEVIEKETKEEIKKEEPIKIEKSTIIENPKTGDKMIYVYIILGYIAFICIMYIISLLKKK